MNLSVLFVFLMVSVALGAHNWKRKTLVYVVLAIVAALQTGLVLLHMMNLKYPQF